MNYFTLFPLSGYRNKFIGLAISTIALILLAINEFLGPDYLPHIKGINSLVIASIWLFCIGLFILTFSKEKIDDERVQKIRYTAIRAMSYFSFIGLFSVLGPFSTNNEDVAQAVTTHDASLILLLLVFPLIGYQIIFNIGLYLNPSWIYNDLGAGENIRKNPKFFLIYTILVTIIFVAFILLNRN